MPELDLTTIDRALATRLMGWQPLGDGYQPTPWIDPQRGYTGWTDAGTDGWQPTRRWDHAGMVVEAMIAREMDPCGIDFNGFDVRWFAGFLVDSRAAHAQGRTFPEAISRAALAALEAKT